MANLQGITRRNGSNKAAKAESSASARTSKECVDEWMDRARGLGDERANARRTSLERNRNRSAECRGQLAAAAVDIAYRGGGASGSISISICISSSNPRAWWWWWWCGA